MKLKYLDMFMDQSKCSMPLTISLTPENDIKTIRVIVVFDKDVHLWEIEIIVVYDRPIVRIKGTAFCTTLIC